MKPSYQFVLVTLYPKEKELGTGILSVDKNGEANFFAGRGEAGAVLLAELKRARLESATADGITLSGMEPTGFNRQGHKTFRLQEWWLRYRMTPQL